ncbi:hypothetical protein [Paenibacillus harenae]|uniref:hypothetical protein n=1 Tax=Paenibacillus harenae TaxID=306543 RepID=UPI002790C10E|nr:hypothetical protein [Paenibacillus harenae]MDQ0058674.1 hypothetical protein [Paenibacillus harenae]
MISSIGTRESLQSWFEARRLAGSSIYFMDRRAIDWQRIANSPLHADMVKEVEEEGDRLLSEPIPELTQELYALFETTGNRLTYEVPYFTRRRRLTTFSLLHLLHPGNSEYKSALERILQAIMTEPTWCLPAHMKGQTIGRHIDLFAAETGFALCEILSMAGDRLPQALRDDMLEQVNRRLFIPYLTYGPYHWETADHNWAAVCAGSIGSAALLVERNNARLAEMIVKALGTMEHYLSGFGADGACLEGPGYWNYGFGYYVYFADLLLNATGGKANLLEHDKVREIALFQQRSYLSGNRPANFSDAMPNVSVHIGLSDYLAAYYEEVEHPPLAIRAAFTEDHCMRYAPALRNFIWFQPEAAREADWKPGSWYLPDAEWLISRTRSSEGSFGFAAKGGNNNEPHNHNDVGHFILLADHDPAFAADLGSGEYTAQYFGEGRYGYDCTGAQGHSIPIIGGRLQQTGIDSAAKVLEAYTSREEDRLELELEACYSEAAGLESFKRRFVWRKLARPILELTDVFRFKDGSLPVTETIVTRSRPALIEDGHIRLEGDRHNVTLGFEPGRYDVSIEEIGYRNHYGKEESYYRIHLTVKGETSNEPVYKLQFQF